MLHNTGPYGPNETPVNMGAPLNISQLTSPMKMVQNLNNLAKMPPQPPQTGGGHFNLPHYPSYGNPPVNVGPQMHPFQNYHSLGFQPSYLPERSTAMLNSAWPTSMQPMAMNMPVDSTQNMLNYAHMDKRMTQPINSYKDPHQMAKTPLNIPQVPNKLYQMHSEPAPIPQNSFENHYKPYEPYKDSDNLDLSMKSPESLLCDNTRRKNLENTVRLIENILINTTKNREMQMSSESTGSDQKHPNDTNQRSPETISNNDYRYSKSTIPNDDVGNDSEVDEGDLDDIPDESDDNNDNADEETSNDRKITHEPSKKGDKGKNSSCINLKPNSPYKPVKEAEERMEVEEEMGENEEMENINELKMVIKEEPREIEVERQVEVKIEQITSWTDTDSMNPFHRDLNGVTRDDVTHGNIIDSEASVVEATAIIQNGLKSDCYFECLHCCLLFENPKRFLVHTKWHSFGVSNKKKADAPKEKQKEEKLHSTRVRECKMCSKRVTGWAAWKAHLASHSSEAGYQCSECPKRFKYSHSLAKHRDTHLEKTHGCAECPKKFGSQALLKVHMKSHERAQKGASFHCTFCGKSFYDKFNLQIHERTHTNERPFVCEICNATFGCNSNLSRHLKVSHSASKPYICSTCNRSFATELIRDRHEMRLHGDPEEFKYTCKQCPSRYLKLVDLRKHTYKMHPKPKGDKSEK